MAEASATFFAFGFTEAAFGLSGSFTCGVSGSCASRFLISSASEVIFVMCSRSWLRMKNSLDFFIDLFKYGADHRDDRCRGHKSVDPLKVYTVRNRRGKPAKLG